MEDEILAKFRQVMDIYKEKFQSLTVQQRNQEYLDDLYEQLNGWRVHTNEQLKELIQEKMEELQQVHDQYYQEIKEYRTTLTEQVTSNTSFAYVDEQLDYFKMYCQSNTIEKRIFVNITALAKHEIAEKIQIEYVPYHDEPCETAIKSLKTIIEEQKPTPEKIEMEYFPYQQRPPIEITTLTSQSVIEDNESTAEKFPVEIVAFHDSSPLSTVISFTPAKTGTKETTEKTPVKIIPYRDLSPEPSIKPLQTIGKERSESIHSSPLSPIPGSIEKHPQQDNYQNRYQLTTTIPKRQVITTTTYDTSPRSSTRMYVGKHQILTPILVDKDRHVGNAVETIAEYSIDAIAVSPDKQQQQQSSNRNNLQLVQAYKVLIKEENDFRVSRSSSLSPDRQGTIHNKFNLKQYNQVDYSTIMFEKCETEYNCLSSSTRRNELIVYNSKLNVLILLQHENHQNSRQRSYLQWPANLNLSSHLSDITYCQNNDQYLISVWDTSHMFFFNRELLSLTKLGKLSDNLPLRRLHCYQQTVYCILGNNHLLEFQLAEDFSSLKFIQKILLFDPNTSSQHTAYHLLDITCDDEHLIVVYPDEQNEIHLQSIHRQTGKFDCDLVLDKQQPINQTYIRIESTKHNGNFVYLNGLQKHLKAIDVNNRTVSSEMNRHTTPTNLCVLKDERLVILYESPYFLSVHG
jgi:hypothetical protein